VLSREELLELAAEQAQKGSVSAIKLLLEELRRDAETTDLGSEFDALDGDNVTPIRKSA
jgi:hypothetical protein